METTMSTYDYANVWISHCVALMLTVGLLPKLRITGVSGVVLTVVCLALVNSFVWDAALFFKIPNSLSSHALTLLLANGVIFWAMVKLLPGIEIDGILPAIVAPVVLTVFNIFIFKYYGNVDWIAFGQRVLEYILHVRDQLTSSKQR